jgi:hypothetical protein
MLYTPNLCWCTEKQQLSCCANECPVQVEAFAMDGRGAMIRRVYPFFWNTSIGVSLIYHVPHTTPSVEPPLVTITVWQMGSGYV